MEFSSDYWYSFHCPYSRGYLIFLPWRCHPEFIDSATHLMKAMTTLLQELQALLVLQGELAGQAGQVLHVALLLQGVPVLPFHVTIHCYSMQTLYHLYHNRQYPLSALTNFQNNLTKYD